MKIIGFTYYDGQTEMTLKGDSCLLANRKPFFMPDNSQDLRFSPCIVLRVSRLGKGIAAKFADRYFDAIAQGADFVAWDRLQEAKRSGKSRTEATCFDYSLAVGAWKSFENEPLHIERDELSIPIAEAIAKASRLMTIRQGDLIYIHFKVLPQAIVRDEVIEQNGLYCKVK
jgi:2-keto-4-pentenoate hydratase/2-oxohepta-3-ene-1,7-dioic acid hydratase in catechol pathway